MTLTEIAALPKPTTEVMRRRARAAGLPTREYLRRELFALAQRRIALDGVVDFLAAERPGHPSPAPDADAAAVIHAYELPAHVWSVLADRAAASAISLADYMRQELITSARRSTVADALLEFDEVLERDPSLVIDREAVAASIRYARGE
ncbi:hypothetical protein BOX37_15100 [Nocardia mangyaensis]|uniref:Uncharacterized protein n=1 Tax=Nocardia mangyaensis TaxID=2213200 RepID=A0A1J0VSN5_9NOCA|nr:hypothetical protein [Nocardia mangyaensis]APE35056.1 hypothetical protein BOX37_15100 [Nocardia mangyaensis]